MVAGCGGRGLGLPRGPRLLGWCGVGCGAGLSGGFGSRGGCRLRGPVVRGSAREGGAPMCLVKVQGQ